MRLHILTSSSGTYLAEIAQRSTAPTETFDFPFLGKSLHDLNAFFLQNIRPLRDFTSSTFIVLDKESGSEKTCIVVEVQEPTSDDDGLATLRTDFYVARQVASLSEVGQEGLLECRDPEMVYTIREVALHV
ncbi:hypothetical protein BDZ85DRAFT_277944 [Elsinoe ampelina]|uniref:Uncharacterized protein n=1 Tax=Elsinoe ampelina TaxID=302913 RepID=A0A6A6GRF1_9PEZI|nr:hypothetical protein BDZ85DRAFT_277944 [Elsinoe ampelina]